jgi:outer membrane protein assembly factor BamB
VILVNFSNLSMKRPILALLLGVSLLVTACSSVEKPKPQPLGPNPEMLAVKRAWSSQIGEVSFPLRSTSVGVEVVIASNNGVVAALDGRTGQDIWRVALNESLAAGVGYDGKHAAVVSKDNYLVVLNAGKVSWRAVLASSVSTPPLVAGNRVFVLAGDRTVYAFDAASGKPLWMQQRGVESLVLKQPGLLTPVGDTLVVGQGGRLVALNPLTGATRWELPVAASRGTNEVEKLIELAAGVARDGQQLCLRAYQNSVACIDTAKPSVQWSKQGTGYSGLAGDSEAVFGVDAQGIVNAYRRSNGEIVWTSSQLRYRQLNAPTVVGRSVVIGDADGNVHLLAKTDGTLLTRLLTDGSPIAAVPVLSAQTLVVVTQRGGVFGFKPE